MVCLVPGALVGRPVFLCAVGKYNAFNAGGPLVKPAKPRRKRPAKSNAKPIATKKNYTMADCPEGVHPRLWRMMIDQGTVESSRGENLPVVTEPFWKSDEELDEFLKYTYEQRRTGHSRWIPD